MSTPLFADGGTVEAQTAPISRAVPARSDPLCLRRKWPMPEMGLKAEAYLDHPLQGTLHCFALATAVVNHIGVLEISRQLPTDAWTVNIWRYEVVASYVYLFVPVFQWSVIAYGIEHLPRRPQHLLQALEGFTLLCLAGVLTCTIVWRDRFSCGATVLLSCNNFESISKVCFNTQIAGVVYFALSCYGSRVYGYVKPEMSGTWHLAALQGSTFCIRFPWLFAGHMLNVVLSLALVGLAGLALHLAHWPTISSGSFLFLTYTSAQNLVISAVLLVHSCLLLRSPYGRRLGKIMEVVAMVTALVAAFDALFWQSQYDCENVNTGACTTIHQAIRIIIGLQSTSAISHLVMALVEAFTCEENPEKLQRIDNQLGMALGVGLCYLGYLVISPALVPIRIYKRHAKPSKDNEKPPESIPETE